jgi:hypothetical protein
MQSMPEGTVLPGDNLKDDELMFHPVTSNFRL